jgi:hypothetical protein
MAKGTLRAVTPGEKLAKPKTLLQAIEGGNYREILLAQRREIASSLPDEKGPAKAALHRQLALISKEIETIEAGALDGADSVVVNTDDEAWDGTGF